jgi:hypothetical protein
MTVIIWEVGHSAIDILANLSLDPQTQIVTDVLSDTLGRGLYIALSGSLQILETILPEA